MTVEILWDVFTSDSEKKMKNKYPEYTGGGANLVRNDELSFLYDDFDVPRDVRQEFFIR